MLPIIAGFGLFRTTTSTAIFVVCSLVSAGVLLYYANRHPHPKFRPKFGELVLVGMIFFGLSVIMTMMTAGLFDQENLDEHAKKQKTRKAPKSSGGGGGSDSDAEGGDSDATDMFEVEAPPFVPEVD
jgi:hypothetical protein